MSKFFLQSKAWQLFIFFIVLYILAGILWSTNLPLNTKKYIFPFISILFVYWAYNLGINLHRKCTRKNNFKKALFVFSLVAAYVIISFPQYLLKNMSFGIWIFINLLYFYYVYFLSKILVSVEKNIDASIYEYGGTFFLFWVMPLGIFWLQPRIRKIFINDDGGA